MRLGAFYKWNLNSHRDKRVPSTLSPRMCHLNCFWNKLKFSIIVWNIGGKLERKTTLNPAGNMGEGCSHFYIIAFLYKIVLGGAR